MFRAISSITGQHEGWLVVLAGLSCVLALLSAVNLVHRARASGSRQRVIWMIPSGVAAIGCGIWTATSLYFSSQALMVSLVTSAFVLLVVASVSCIHRPAGGSNITQSECVV